MSYYDDASLVFLAQGAAGKGGAHGGMAYALKPEGEVEGDELVLNGDFSIDGGGTDGALEQNTYGAWGWNLSAYHGSDSSSTIKNGVLTLTNGTDGDAFAYATDGNGSQDRDVLKEDGYYRLTYTIVSKKLPASGVTNRLYGYWKGSYHDIPADVGTHVVEMDHFPTSSNKLFLFRLMSDNDQVVIDNVSIKKIKNRTFDFDVDRGSDIGATRIDSDGNVEKGTRNHLTNSNDFSVGGGSGGWYKTVASDNTHPAVLTSGQKGHDGSYGAWKLEAGSNPGTEEDREAYIRQASTNSGMQTFSVYAKAGNVEYVRIIGLGNNNGQTSNANAFFRLSGEGTKTYGNNIVSDSIRKVGDDGWYRISITFNRDLVTGCRIQVADGNGNSDGFADSAKVTEGDYIYIQDAQLEYGMYPTKYYESGIVPGIGGVKIDEPRFDYEVGGCPQLLIETARTNKVIWSEYYNATAWDAQTRGSTRTWKKNEVNPSGNYGCYEYHATASDNQLGIVCSELRQ